MNFSGDSSDSTVTVSGAKCHHNNYCSHKDLSCTGDRSDRVLNFSAEKTDIKCMVRRACVYRKNELRKSVTTVTRHVQVFTPYEITWVTVCEKHCHRTVTTVTRNPLLEGIINNERRYPWE